MTSYLELYARYTTFLWAYLHDRKAKLPTIANRPLDITLPGQSDTRTDGNEVPTNGKKPLKEKDSLDVGAATALYCAVANYLPGGSGIRFTSVYSQEVMAYNVLIYYIYIMPTTFVYVEKKALIDCIPSQTQNGKVGPTTPSNTLQVTRAQRFGIGEVQNNQQRA